MSTRAKYPTDLTEPQWALLQPLLPPRKWRRGGPGRPPGSVRTVINGLLYLTKTGCQWSMLPPSFGRWKTVYGYFSRWSRTGVWQQLMETLTQQERQRQGRKVHLRRAVSIVRASRRQPKARQRVMMGAKKSMGANATSWSILWDSLSACWSPRLILEIGTA